MNPQTLCSSTVAVSLFAALALSGCGGGGGTTMPEPMPEPPVPTIAESLASADTQFTPLTAAMRVDFNQSSVSLTDDFRVTSISSDGANGWMVTYVLGGVEGMLHFGHGDRVVGSPGDFKIESDEGREHWFFSRYSRHLEEGTEQQFTYSDNIGGSVGFGDARDRFMLVYGNRTGTAGLPAGSALYRGGLYIRSQPNTVGSSGSSGRINIDGRVRLVANFVAGTLEGGVSGIRFERYDENGNRGRWEPIPTTNRFAFENGRITGARFMAELIGMDSGSNALDDTVQGFEGTVDGEFYGPAAEEMGAVVSVESAGHSRVGIGNIRTDRLNPRTFDGERVPLSVGIERDHPSSQVQLTDTTTVTAIEGDGSGGFHVTYRVDGTDERVHLEASDYGSDPDFTFLYASEGPNSPYSLFDMSDSFRVYESPEFDHFNAQGWVVATYDANGDDENIRRGLMVYGDGTEVADLPAGTASYDGRMHAFTRPSNNTASDAGRNVRGSMSLTADFASSDVTGTFHNLETRQSGSSRYEALTGALAISNGVISGNGFTAELAGSVSSGNFDGDMSGQFFGPVAAEVGGVFSGEYTETGAPNVVWHGFFGGKKQ